MSSPGVDCDECNGERYAAVMPQAPGREPLAVVPLKALDRAKGRLAEHLDAAARRELVRWMFTRVVLACRAASTVADVLVVAGDEAAAGLARDLDVRVIVEPRAGLGTAMATADRAAGGAAASLVVAADLPLAGAADIEAVCRAGQRGPCVVVVPTRDGGTAVLLRRPVGVIPTSYGPGSCAAHLRGARSAGVHTVRLERPGLALDVDTADDLRALRAGALPAAPGTSGLSAG